MKRGVAVLLIMIMAVSMAACSGWSSSKEKYETGELTLSVDRCYFVTGQKDKALFTVQGSKDLRSVTLYDDSGSKVGRMKDDGKAGDTAASDGIYTLVVLFGEDWTGSEETFYAEADGAKSNSVSLYSFTPPETEEEAEEHIKAFNRVMAGIETIEDRYFNDDGYVPEEKYPQLTNEILNFLEEHKGKEVLLYEAEDQNIYIKYTSGITSMYAPVMPDTAGDGYGDLELWIYQPNWDMRDAGMGEGDSVSIRLQPYVDNVPNLTLAGEFDEEDVTPGLIGRFPSNAVIYYNGHGGCGPIVQSYLCTGLKFTRQYYWENYLFFYSDAILCRSTKKQRDMLCVTPIFFKLPDIDLTNDVILLGSCCGLKTEWLAQTMLDKGARAVLGFDEEVAIGYSMEICLHVIERLCTISAETGKFHTLSEGLAFAKAFYQDDDYKWALTIWKPEEIKKKSVARPKILGDENLRLFDVEPESDERESTNPAPETSSEPATVPDSVNILDYWGHFDDLRKKVGITGTSTDPDHFLADPLFSEKPTLAYGGKGISHYFTAGVDTVEADGARVEDRRSRFEPILLAKGWKLMGEYPVKNDNPERLILVYEKEDEDSWYQLRVTCTMATDGDPFIWYFTVYDHAELLRD